MTTVQGYSFAEFADIFSFCSFESPSIYLAFRDVPDLLQKYSKGKVALDYGYGPGKSSMFLEKLGFWVDGVDISEPMVNIARKTLPEMQFQVLQGGKIPAEDEHYDLIFCSWVLQEIGPKQNLIAALLEIARVLKADGIFAAVVSSEAGYSKEWIHANGEFEENKNLKSGDKAKVLSKEKDNFFGGTIFGLSKIIEKC